MKKIGLILVSIIVALQGCMVTSAIASDRSEKDKKICEMYRDRLKKYEKEGVMGINPMTGKVQKMDKEQAREAIKDTKENISIFCN